MEAEPSSYSYRHTTAETPKALVHPYAVLAAGGAWRQVDDQATCLALERARTVQVDDACEGDVIFD